MYIIYIYIYIMRQHYATDRPTDPAEFKIRPHSRPNVRFLIFQDKYDATRRDNDNDATTTRQRRDNDATTTRQRRDSD